jgi:fused signal recognition particle receptor
LGLLGRFQQALAKTRERIGVTVRAALSVGRELDEPMIEALEEALYGADLGAVGTAVMEEARRAYALRYLSRVEQVPEFLRERLLARLEGCGAPIARAVKPPTVVLVCGVNGSGKTTSIAKLAAYLQRGGAGVLLGAGDTFRAAAVEQLTLWAERLGVPIVKHASGADPAAVAFDAADAGAARGVDYVIVDTAGRLHTQKSLMSELEKISRVLARRIPGAPHETLLVLDATTGQNMAQQAALFSEAVPITGLVLAKLDGTAKGGAVFGLRERVKIPVKLVGLGESLEDLERFDSAAFVEAIVEPFAEAARKA